MSQQSMRHRRYQELMLLVHGKQPPNMTEWHLYAEQVAAMQKGPDPIKTLLVFSNGGGPNAAQRAEIVAAFGDHPTPVYVCSSSALARGITTAIGWIYRQPLYSFNYDDLAGALAKASISRDRFDDIAAKVMEEQVALGARPFRLQALAENA